ncbi:hypothetical protein Cni_G16490 [Canna indica]|uniref:Reverse transcriptase zinc-binding domain-containing protein n=1 Tax=Canna indica TaxID=4628 RepID=A0AAQ3KF75_9LILI|nr:hypothetical protein Cni_G16490 [Canna indica]
MQSALSAKRVYSLLDGNSSIWGDLVSAKLFDPDLALSVFSINLALNPEDDKWVWVLENNGLVSCKSAYRYLACSYAHGRDNPPKWSAIWKLSIGPRVKHFTWKICEALAVKSAKEDALRYRCCFLWVDVEPAALVEQLGRQVEEMVAAGVIEELAQYFAVEAVPKAGESRHLGLGKAIGVAQFREYFGAKDRGT